MCRFCENNPERANPAFFYKGFDIGLFGEMNISAQLGKPDDDDCDPEYPELLYIYEGTMGSGGAVRVCQAHINYCPMCGRKLFGSEDKEDV